MIQKNRRKHKWTTPQLLDSMVHWITRGVHYYAKKVVEAVTQDGLSDQEAARIYEIQGHDRIQNWVRIYLEEGPEGLAVERRGRGSKGRPKNCPKK